MATFGIVHTFPGGTKEQYEASIKQVHPADGTELPEGQTYHAAGATDDGWIVVALWDLRAEAERFRRRLLAAGADEVVATLQEAVLAVRLSPARTAEPAELARELKRALREDLPKAEALLAEAERLLPFEALAVEVLQPALEGVRHDAAAGRITDEQETLAGDLLRDRLLALGGVPQRQRAGPIQVTGIKAFDHGERRRNLRRQPIGVVLRSLAGAEQQSALDVKQPADSKPQDAENSASADLGKRLDEGEHAAAAWRPSRQSKRLVPFTQRPERGAYDHSL